MFNIDQFKEFIIKPALIDLVMFTEEAMELLVFTCAVESHGGTYLKQIKGPALGIYQMEPETYIDIWKNYLDKKNSILMMLLSNFQCTFMPDEFRMVYDLRFATAMARIHYARVPEKLPAKDDIDGLWNYYKKYYNTAKGAAKKAESIEKYKWFMKS